MNKKTWVIFLTSGTLIIAALAGYLLFSSRETERKLRLAAETELSRKVAEVAEKQSQIRTLIQQKSDLEEQFNTKVAILESTVRDYDENSKALSARMESVIRESDAMKRDFQDKDKKIDELSRKVHSLEADKASLLETLNKSAAAATVKTDAPADGDTQSGEPGDPVKLGKIIVQKTSGHAARVDYIDKLNGFIVITAGSKDGIKKESVVNIVRGNKLIGKAVVQKVRAETSAAVIISEWTKEDIKIGDQVGRFS